MISYLLCEPGSATPLAHEGVLSQPSFSLYNDREHFTTLGCRTLERRALLFGTFLSISPPQSTVNLTAKNVPQDDLPGPFSLWGYRPRPRLSLSMRRVPLGGFPPPCLLFSSSFSLVASPSLIFQVPRHKRLPSLDSDLSPRPIVFSISSPLCSPAPPR